MSALLDAVLPQRGPGELAAVERCDDPPGLTPLPEEEPLIAKSVAKRRNEFVTVRYCARLALQQLGEPPVPILKGEKGEPRWPDGVVGSLTHTAGFRGAVVGRVPAVRSVGIDAEPHDVLPNGVLDAVSLPVERTELAALPASLHWDRILFCAKEATYKVWFPLTQRWLGFEDAHITFSISRERACPRPDTPADDPEPRTLVAGGEFVSQILIDPAARSGPPLTTLRGRWAVADGLVLTAIVL
ncbi:4'-phosphopantetheinyl transferase family protein [Mycobacterium talmoniae]|uniref:4'-phosphopantetheinyl transferase n=1 Tax=Mycobacterium talmoniae TaxID=1858794 RepID=A0A1S1NEC9_9MYCO|nr:MULTISPECIES: 4'-phosphopantetheinyl transferase [Mycobacterium]OHV04033.1 4'-phosphopantetheinyl transferase [Mycobacterium talmoniae]PQM47184.1 4'-phosphopantetheinyl transferase Npt [Mycobacterium talmoniae]TDH49246.1 4'-phosphopantetheinyl transferase superfamily protein [Mycobacterium eburneum]